MTEIDFTMLISVIGGLTLCTNIITEVVKKMFPKFPAQIFATIIAILLTLAAFFAYVSINAIVVQWYMVLGAVVLGFFVSYAAQFGFDKLKEVIEKYTRGL